MDEIELSAVCSSALFANISREDTEQMLRCLGADRRTLKSGEVLWHAGSTVSSCGIVLSGSVRAEALASDGSRSVTAVHFPGAVIGDILMAAEEQKSPVDVLAAGDAAVLLLPFERIMAGCGAACTCHTQLRENLMASVAKKFWALRRKLSYLSVRSLRGRISRYLLDERNLRSASTFSTGLNREDLADYLGVNRSALSRELGRMQTEGLISFYKDTFQIKNPAALAAAGAAEEESAARTRR